jgi:hypothetical protein
MRKAQDEMIAIDVRINAYILYFTSLSSLNVCAGLRGK